MGSIHCREVMISLLAKVEAFAKIMSAFAWCFIDPKSHDGRVIGEGGELTEREGKMPNRY